MSFKMSGPTFRLLSELDTAEMRSEQMRRNQERLDKILAGRQPVIWGAHLQKYLPKSFQNIKIQKNDRFVDLKEACQRLNTSRTTLWRWRRAKKIPPAYPDPGGRRLGWLESDFAKILSALKR